MDTGTENRVKVKIFVGFEQKADIKIALNQNSAWKEAKVSKTTDLREILYQDQDYIGVFLTHGMTTMQLLQNVSEKVREELQRFCPEIDLSKLKIQVFPQVFVS